MSPVSNGLSILMVGDVYINRLRPASIFRKTAAILRDADVTMVNLEGVIGGAELSLGAWVFMMCIFAGGWMAAWFVRKQWI